MRIEAGDLEVPFCSLKKEAFVSIIIPAGLPIVTSHYGIHCICLSHNLYEETLNHANCTVLMQLDMVKRRELVKQENITAESHSTCNMLQMLTIRHFLQRKLEKVEIFTAHSKSDSITLYFLLHMTGCFELGFMMLFFVSCTS